MIYRLTYCNRNGDTARVDIIKGALTPIETIEGTENPFILSYKMDKPDKSGHFMTSVADISLYESGTFNIDELKTSNETGLKVEYYINDILTWSGFVIPDFFSREIGTPAVVTMVASDRIGTLKNTSLSGLPTMITLRELTLLCLAKTGLSLPLKTMADFSHGTGVNDFFNSKILTQRLSDTKGRNVSCYDILSSILIASNSKLVQRKGEWYIVNNIQHEEGSGKLYNTATAYVNWSEVVLDFSEVTVGGRRTIMPVASSVGVYQEYGGSKTYPSNYNFVDGATGWTVNFPDEMEARFDNHNILGFDVLTSGGGYQPVYGDETNNPHMVVYGFRGPLNYVKSADIPVPEGYQSEVNIKFDINASGPVWNFGSHQRMAVFAVKDSVTKVLTSSGGFVDLSQTTSDEYVQRIDFEGGPVLVGQLARVSTKSFTISGKLTDTGGLDGYSIHIRLYSSDRAYATVINFASINFDTVGDSAKGTIYKVEQGVDFTQVHDIETTIFGDYITSGVNGYFYDYPKDDTSSLYNSANELTTLWTTPSDTTAQPLLLHVARQKSRMFSIAHDLISVEIDVPVFDPLAIFRDCNNRRYTVVSAKFNFLNSLASVEIEQSEQDELIMKRDFIYSYFAESGDSIKSVGGIPSGGSSGGGGAPAPQYWYLDEDGNLRTDYNAYSTKELSAYGLGPQGGGGGGTMVTWGDTVNNYSLLTVEGVSKNVALSGHKHAWSDLVDLPDTLSGYGITDAYTKTQVDQLLDGVGAGSVTSVGMTVPTGLTVTGSPITTSGILALGFQSGYSIPTTAKQNNWDAAYTNAHTHSNKTQIDLITQAHINVLNKLFIDADGNVYTTENFYSTKEVSAYGLGSGGGGGTGYDRLDAWADYDSLKSGWVLSALLGVDLNTRLSNVEGGSATSVSVTGTGDVIVGGSKSGNVITLTRGNQSWANLTGKPSTFAPSAHSHSASDITSGIFNIARIPTGTSDTTVALGNHLHTGVYEPVFTKNTAFNKNFGTTSGTVAQGNDSRINNGQTAYGWGNHASAGYALNSALTAHINKVDNPHAVTKAQVGLGNVDNVKQATKSEFDTHTANSTIHITSTERTNWNDANSKKHTHGNKSVIDALTQGNIDVLSKLSIDANGNLKIDTNAYATGELSAYGAGTGGGSGPSYERLDSWADYATGKEGWVLSALLGVDLNTRLSNVESGSATSITTTGSGNAITSVSKSGNTLTFTKGSTFSLSTHNHDTIYKPIGYVPSWSEITGKPSTFAPSAHTHTIANITGLQSALDGKQATLTPGSNITITGNTISAVDTTYGVATTSANGLMSSADKSKLNGIESNANNYSLPTASASVLGGIKVGSRLTISSGVLSANVQSDNNFTSAYKTKLDGIETGANNYVHPSSHPISFITGLQSALDLKAVGGLTVDFTSTASLNNTLNGLVSGVTGSPISGSSVVGFWTTLESNKNFGGGFFTRLGRAFTLTKENGVIQSWQELAYLTSNVASATKLQTARTINGTSFDGSANITTANWGTARTLTVGNTGKSVNGSGNVSWSLSEIGALPITGGTMTGILKAQNNTSYTTKQVRNIILSTADANAASMANGDIWIKYE